MPMNALSQFFADRASDAAIDLLVKTTAAIRADANFLHGSEDAAAGAALSEEPPVDLSVDALATTLSQIDRAEALDHGAANRAGKGARAAEIAALPSPVREVALAAMGRQRWRFGGFGIRRLPLMTGDGAFVELMRIEPGRGVADHDHADDELTLILTGSYHDGHHHYGPGDLSLARPGFTHRPKADHGEVCYVLAISYGAPKLLGLFQVLQRSLAEPADARSVWRAR